MLLSVLLTPTTHAGEPFPGGPDYPTYTNLNSWSFLNVTNWKSDRNYLPVSFTNLSSSWLGDGASLVVDTNLPAWLQYNVYESSGATNLTVDSGTLMFWFAPSSWASTNAGSDGPGEAAQLIDVGEWTTNAAYGYWGLSVDSPGQNLWFISQDGAGNTYTLSTPISWTPNYFHSIALTYCATNVAIYLDGDLATNDAGGLSIWPGRNVLTNGIFFGSDLTGGSQAHGMFNSVQTYNVPLPGYYIGDMFDSQFPIYQMNPFNTAMFDLVSGTNATTVFSTNNDVITGPGNFSWSSNAVDCVQGTGAYDVWLTNVVAKESENGLMSLQFTIAGGLDISNRLPFDVFANSILTFGTNGAAWAWEGQGLRCNTYVLSGMPKEACYLILGTPKDSDHDGLTDAYEMLVSKSSTTNYSTDGTGMADGWEILYFGHTGVSPTGDPDGDGLTTYQEWLMNSKGYDPTALISFASTGVGDGYQNFSGDGLANLMQASFGGNMFTNNATWKVDTDGDGLPNEYKVMVGVSTTSPPLAPVLPAYSKIPLP
jgi:hypothetical protein